MTTFNELTDVTDFKHYKAAIKSALGKLRAGSTGVNFVYIEKFGFSDKERPLVLIDHDPQLVSQLGKKPTATGKCKVDDADRIEFAANVGTVNIDKAQRLFTDVGVPRAVADPDAPAPTGAKLLEGETLNMKYGWSEMRTWGDEAAALIEKFDGLVGLYKSIPEVKPEWKDLDQRHDDVKEAMAEMVRTRIVNTPKARNDHQALVEKQIETVRQLIADIRKRATAPVAKPQASKPGTTPPTGTTKQPETGPTSQTTPQAPKEQPKVTPTQTEVSKPVLTAKEIQSRVSQTLPVKGKDDAVKYTARMERVLKSEFAEVSASHLKAIELLADKTWFTKSEEPEATTKTEKVERMTLTDTQKRDIDTAMRTAVAAANGPAEMLDNKAQVALGDALTAAIGGNYPTHSRDGGHKGSFTKDKSIQQQLSNIGAILNAKVREAINEHFATAWPGYNV
ncbi:MAG: hypothetical protein K8R60_06040 [Burkholderiales bacterium]|nr:hypothetical protein [Burkholderiales bacterium]